MQRRLPPGWQPRPLGSCHLHTPPGAATLLRMAGPHNVHNALAAAACALAAGVPLAAVVQGWPPSSPVAGRSRLLPAAARRARVTLVDDSYNANPDSVRAAIDVLATLPAPRWLVLGDMGEVGDQGPAFHAEVGAYARAPASSSSGRRARMRRRRARLRRGRLRRATSPTRRALLAALGEGPRARCW
jgi:UDP-N-acetylmuramoyl-tripeptide--D-alanyl-D-alanine ligase